MIKCQYCNNELSLKQKALMVCKSSNIHPDIEITYSECIDKTIYCISLVQGSYSILINNFSKMVKIYYYSANVRSLLSIKFDYDKIITMTDANKIFDKLIRLRAFL